MVKRELRAMINSNTLTALICAVLLSISSFAQLNLNLVGQLDYQGLHSSDISDVWGYTDEFGNEYALVGVNNGGVSVVDLSDPNNPNEIFFYSGPSSTWRDLKVWGDHAYITTEGGGGLAIIDLTPLPASNSLTAVSWQGSGWVAAHNLFIDEFGICYIFGANRGNGGVIFLDLTIDPMNPIEVGEFDNWYCHDGMARGDTLYAAHISDGFFSILDVSDKQNVQILGTQTTGNNFAHNIWVSDNGDHVFTTDEVSSGYIGSYDITDPSDIKEIDLVLSDPGSGTIPHNTHVIGDFIFTAYYRLGCTIHDVSRPDNVIEVGYYDTSPMLAGNGYNGSWGAYPYLPSGLALGTDIENGLFIFDAQYVHACWLEGTVTDAVTLAPVYGASIAIQSIAVEDSSRQDGTYGTGYHAAGLYDVIVSMPGYVTQTITGVQLVNNQVTNLDVQLQPLVSFALTGVVDESVTANAVPNAIINIQNIDFNFTVTADAGGNFNLAGVFEGTYDISVGAWGWQTLCQTSVVINQSSSPLSFTLDPGYMDDFALDLGWTASFNGATSGYWERDEPIGTTLQGNPSNPDVDVTGDCSDKAYITGNGGFGAGVDDIDDGYVYLTSPAMDLTSYISPRISYYRWFFNSGGSGNPDDEMIIWLTDGTDTVALETIDANTAGNQTWLQKTWVVSNFINPAASMRLVVEASDQGAGHIVEGGLDLFEVMEGPTSIDELLSTSAVSVYPNPNSGRYVINWEGVAAESIEIMDVQGRVVFAEEVTGAQLNGPVLNAGHYHVIINSSEGKKFVERLVVQ